METAIIKPGGLEEPIIGITILTFIVVWLACACAVYIFEFDFNVQLRDPRIT